MEKRFVIDYLTLTFGNREALIELIPPSEWLEWGGKYYQSAYRTWDDGYVMLNETGSKQGCFVSFGGQCLAKMREQDELTTVKWLAMNARAITRLDLACDIIVDCEANKPLPETFYELHKLGQCITRTKERELVESSHVDKDDKRWEGKTCYIGSKKSQRLLRIYDKAAELRVPDTFWTRFEMQHRDSQAEAKFQDCLNNGVALATFNSITSFCSFGAMFEWLIEPQYAEGAIGEFAKVGRKETSFDRYLEQVKKTLVKRSKTSKQNYDKIVKWLHDLADEVILDG